MTLTKIALTVLGTVGLAAGTVLAFAEPAPSELPQGAAQASACAGCPSRTCGTAKCIATAASIQAAASPCAAENAACATNCEDGGACRRETAECDAACTAVTAESPCHECPNAIGGPIDPPSAHRLSSFIAAACDSAQQCSAEETCTNAAPGHARKLTLSFGISSNGPILRLTSGTLDPAEATCPAATSGCGASCHQVATSCCASACEQVSCQTAACAKENCTESGTCEKCCHEAQCLTATSCEAQPACATSGCPAAACQVSACHAAGCSASACSASACDGSACENEACAASKCSTCPHACCSSHSVAAEEGAGSSSACSVEACDCQECCCEACDCVTDGACPPGVLCPIAARIHEILSSGPVSQPVWHHPPVLPEAAYGNFDPIHAQRSAERTDASVRNYDSYRMPGDPSGDAPGRVRLTHLPDIRFWAAPPNVPPHANLIVTSFAAPVVAPMPPSAPASPRVIEGSWTRTSGPWTVTFGIENGRLRGTCTAEGATVRFSGTCGVSDDGQIFGVLDEADISSDAQEQTAEARAIAVRLIDQPFAVRFRFDGDSLIVKDLRCAGLPPEQVRQVACGRFERSE